MNLGIRRTILPGLLALVLLGLGPGAHAFFPIGGFTEDGRLRYIRWARSYMDTNLDGDVSGPDEGVEVTLEGGDWGWTHEEQQILREAFDVWQNVPTSFVAFYFAPSGPIPDPLNLLPTNNDLINFMAIEVPEDPIPSGAVGGGVLGVTILTFFVDDTQVDYGGYGFPVTGGQIIEADIVIDGTVVRPAVPGEDPEIDLFSVMVHEIGHFVGLDHTPVNNLEMTVTPAGEVQLIENPVLAMRDASGQLNFVGATPTMFPFYFEITDLGGETSCGAGDLAPDDVASVSILYPRGQLDNLFNISDEARTQTRRNFPSLPIAGGHVMAWCDVDNDPLTPRIPIFSTMTGLFAAPAKDLQRGKFKLVGLYKELETLQGVTFQASYTLTINPLNGLDVPGQPPDFYDSTHVESGVGWSYDLVFPSEVFREGDNLFGLEKHDLGTPLVYDPGQQTVVSAITGKALSDMLLPQQPMFGDRNEICPFNVTTGGLKSNNGPTALRRFRDGVLLQTALGAAVVDAYYRVSPAMARFLLRHTSAMNAARTAARAVEWSFAHHRALRTAALVAVLLTIGYRLRRRSLLAASVLFVAAFCLLAVPSSALLVKMTTEEMVSMADAIVEGTVSAVDCHWTEDERSVVVTDVTIEIEDSLKGRLNKGSQVSFRQLGGRIGEMITYVSELPAFAAGENVMVYLIYKPDYGYMVVGGKQGKHVIRVNAKTGKKHIVAPAPEKKLSPAGVPARKNGDEAGTTVKKKDDEAPAGQVPLEDYKQYVREIVKQQKKQTKP